MTLRILVAGLFALAVTTGATAAPGAEPAHPRRRRRDPDRQRLDRSSSIRARYGALMDFNVISMRYRGLIEFAGAPGEPLMKPLDRSRPPGRR